MIKAQGGIFGSVAESGPVVTALKAVGDRGAKHFGALRHKQELIMTAIRPADSFRPTLWARATGMRSSASAPTSSSTCWCSPPAALRAQDAGRDRVRPHPAGDGLMMCLSTFYYAYLAYRLAQRTGRNDVCALPSGISVPHMFIVTFVIMLPIALKTSDPIKAGKPPGMVFFQSFILMIAASSLPSFAGSRRARRCWARWPACRSPSSPCVRRWKCTRRRDRPDLLWHHPGQLARGFRYPRGIPAGLVAIAVGMLIAWGSTALGSTMAG